MPVTLHKEHNVYVPELIFGHLLTSSNYDDDEKKGEGRARAREGSRAGARAGARARGGRGR